MGCGCNGIMRGGASGLLRSVFWAWNNRVRANPNEIDPNATTSMGMHDQGVVIPFDARQFFSIREKPRDYYPAADAPPTWYIPIRSGELTLNDRFSRDIPNGFMRPYSTGIQRGETQALWGVQRRQYQPITTVVPLRGAASVVGNRDNITLCQFDRVGAQDARTALAHKQGNALQFPRWFTGAVDEDALVARARRRAGF